MATHLLNYVKRHHMNDSYKQSLKIICTCLIIIVVILLFAVLVVARDFIYPIGLGILLAYLIYPLVKFMEKILPSRILATLLSILLSIVVIGGFFFFLYQQFSVFLDELPELEKNARANLLALQESLNRYTPLSFDADNTLIDSLLGTNEEGNNLIKEIFNATTGTLVGLGLQPVYAYFLLYYRHHFRDFLYKVTSGKYHNTLTNILKDIADVTKNYVSGVFIVVIILCFLNSFGLLIIGIEYAVMFGILSALMNFIPYFGTLIGAAFPLFYTLASEEPSDVWSVVILFLIIQFTENNILTPTITGGRVAINPLFTIFIIIIGSLAWGIPGMFLFVPFVGMFKVVCENIEPLKPIAFLISPRNPSRQNRIVKKVKKLF
jgi:predicted PurR-regulated permease PerM